MPRAHACNPTLECNLAYSAPEPNWVYKLATLCCFFGRFSVEPRGARYGNHCVTSKARDSKSSMVWVVVGPCKDTVILKGSMSVHSWVEVNVCLGTTELRFVVLLTVSVCDLQRVLRVCTSKSEAQVDCSLRTRAIQYNHMFIVCLLKAVLILSKDYINV